MPETPGLIYTPARVLDLAHQDVRAAIEELGGELTGEWTARAEETWAVPKRGSAAEQRGALAQRMIRLQEIAAGEYPADTAAVEDMAEAVVRTIYGTAHAPEGFYRAGVGADIRRALDRAEHGQAFMTLKDAAAQLEVDLTSVTEGIKRGYVRAYGVTSSEYRAPGRGHVRRVVRRSDVAAWLARRQPRSTEAA